MENGEIPDEDALLGPMIRNICYQNADRYMAFPDIKGNGAIAKPAGARKVRKGK